MPDVKLRLWSPQGVDRVAAPGGPEVLDITATGTPPAPRQDYLLGGWAPGESRDYHVRIKVSRPASATRCWPAGSAWCWPTARWPPRRWSGPCGPTTPRSRPAWIATSPTTPGQAELADAIQEGLHAAKAGDEKTATVKLGRAVQLAAASGNEDTMRLLAKVVDVDDAEAGTIRLRKATDKEAEMTLDTRSTRTVRLGKGKGEGGAGEGRGRRRSEGGA